MGVGMRAGLVHCPAWAAGTAAICVWPLGVRTGFVPGHRCLLGSEQLAVAWA